MAQSVRKPAPALHERDFHAWTVEQAAALRAGRLDRIDLTNVSEEIESLGRSERHEIRNRLSVLLLHLLKWAYQPEARSSGWKGTIIEQRSRLSDLISENPSLHDLPANALAKEYRIARLKAADETNLPEEGFPLECPFTIGEISDDSFWPGVN